ncbi:mucin-5AC-like isoform X1 [Sycon ciliatum]|uniref:mucin-5AC-like isoform X1 n=1 Tax=Sycon ciliatum TaxID=27933 RepID=UPI0031F651A8
MNPTGLCSQNYNLFCVCAIQVINDLPPSTSVLPTTVTTSVQTTGAPTSSSSTIQADTFIILPTTQPSYLPDSNLTGSSLTGSSSSSSETPSNSMHSDVGGPNVSQKPPLNTDSSTSSSGDFTSIAIGAGMTVLVLLMITCAITLVCRRRKRLTVTITDHCSSTLQHQRQDENAGPCDHLTQDDCAPMGTQTGDTYTALQTMTCLPPSEYAGVGETSTGIPDGDDAYVTMTGWATTHSETQLAPSGENEAYYCSTDEFTDGGHTVASSSTGTTPAIEVVSNVEYANTASVLMTSCSVDKAGVLNEGTSAAHSADQGIQSPAQHTASSQLPPASNLVIYANRSASDETQLNSGKSDRETGGEFYQSLQAPLDDQVYMKLNPPGHMA